MSNYKARKVPQTSARHPLNDCPYLNEKVYDEAMKNMIMEDLREYCKKVLLPSYYQLPVRDTSFRLLIGNMDKFISIRGFDKFFVACLGLEMRIRNFLKALVETAITTIDRMWKPIFESHPAVRQDMIDSLFSTEIGEELREFLLELFTLLGVPELCDEKFKSDYFNTPLKFPPPTPLLGGEHYNSVMYGMIRFLGIGTWGYEKDSSSAIRASSRKFSREGWEEPYYRAILRDVDQPEMEKQFRTNWYDGCEVNVTVYSFDEFLCDCGLEYFVIDDDCNLGGYVDYCFVLPGERYFMRSEDFYSCVLFNKEAIESMRCSSVGSGAIQDAFEAELEEMEDDIEDDLGELLKKMKEVKKKIKAYKKRVKKGKKNDEYDGCRGLVHWSPHIVVGNRYGHKRSFKDIVDDVDIIADKIDEARAKREERDGTKFVSGFRTDIQCGFCAMGVTGRCGCGWS